MIIIKWTCTYMCTCKHSNSLYTVIIHSLEISAAFVHRVRLGPQDTVSVTITNDGSESFISSGKASLFRGFSVLNNNY